MKQQVKKLLPDTVLRYLKHLRQKFINKKRRRLCVVDEVTFRNILTSDLGLTPGDVVFIHSSLRNLSVAFPFHRLWQIIQDVVGADGTLLFPTYPRLPSYAYLTSGEVFDVRTTPSYTGYLTEFARQQPNAIRSLHPTKSVCALGPLAKELTSEHHKSPYPYDMCSPYFKIVEEQSAKIIGLGVTTHNLPFVHCVSDILKDEFVVDSYHKPVFEAKCINYQAELEIVRTYAHDLSVTGRRHTPRYMHRYIAKEICSDMQLYGRKFFVVRRPKALFEEMLHLAKEGITIYPKMVEKEK